MCGLPRRRRVHSLHLFAFRQQRLRRGCAEHRDRSGDGGYGLHVDGYQQCANLAHDVECRDRQRTVSYAVTANATTSSRTGTITVGGQTFTVTQAAATSCSYLITPPAITWRPRAAPAA